MTRSRLRQGRRAVLIAAVLTALPSCGVGARPTSSPKPKAHLLHIQLPAHVALKAGAKVVERGRTIGRVQAVERRSGPRADLLIDPAYAPVSAKARVLIRRRTLLADDLYVELRRP